MIAGSGLVLSVLGSAVRTVVLPRAAPVLLTRSLFGVVGWGFDLRVRRLRTYEDRDRIMAFYAPLTLMLLPGVWVALITTGFTGVYWGFGVDPLVQAFELSGSSLLTLGFVAPHDIPTHVAAFIEASIGLGVVALLISYLPSIYSAFQRRELGVARMATLGGMPPSAIAMIERYHALERLAAIDELWDEWNRWFDDIEETHTSQPSLVWFRSIDHDRSWVTAAGALLDAAAFRAAVLDMPRDPEAELCLRSGYLALRRIATYYGIGFDPDPRPTTPSRSSAPSSTRRSTSWPGLVCRSSSTAIGAGRTGPDGASTTTPRSSASPGW